MNIINYILACLFMAVAGYGFVSALCNLTKFRALLWFVLVTIPCILLAVYFACNGTNYARVESKEDWMALIVVFLLFLAGGGLRMKADVPDF